MIGSGNNRMNNIINRRPQQQQAYQDINDFDNISTPKSKYYQSSYNNLYKNNQSNNNNNNNNSMNKQNIRMNITKNNMNNINLNNNIYNINNNQSYQYHNINQIQNNNINKALLVIRSEFKKKDDRIKALELKIAELENKINLISKTNNYNTENNPFANIINISQKKLGKNYTFAEKNSEEINQGEYIKNSNLNRGQEINYIRRNNPFRNNDNNQNMNNVYAQTKSANQYKIKNNNDNGFIMATKNNNITDAAVDGSTFTGNSSNFQRHSKNDVKLFLKEVKSKVDPTIFKEFIQNIKLLTNSKGKNGSDKNSVIEKVRILFGEQFKDLFIKFESILGFNNS